MKEWTSIRQHADKKRIIIFTLELVGWLEEGGYKGKQIWRQTC